MGQDGRVDDIGLRDIVDFSVGLGPTWHAMPLAGDAREWAKGLAAGLTEDEVARTTLTDELVFAQGRLAGMGRSTLRAAVWIPFPETGRAGAALVFELTPVSTVGDPDGFEAFLEGAASREIDGQSYYSVRTWRSEVDAGPLVGAYDLIAHDGLTSDGGDLLEERVVIGVFPPGTTDFVQFIFSAENLGVFTNMPQETQDMVASLQITTEAAR